MPSEARRTRLAANRVAIAARQPRRTGPVASTGHAPGRGRIPCGAHRWGGWVRVSDDPVRFRRQCRRRSCPATEAVAVTPEQIVALDAQIAANPATPYGETSGRHLIGRARHGGRVVLIPVGR